MKKENFLALFWSILTITAVFMLISGKVFASERHKGIELTRTVAEIDHSGQVYNQELFFSDNNVLNDFDSTMHRQSILWHNIFPVMMSASISLGYENRIFFGGTGGGDVEYPMVALYNIDSPDTLWTFSRDFGSEWYVAASETEDIFCALEYHENLGYLHLHRWNSTSRQPIWTYNFDNPSYELAYEGPIKISFDNSVIVVALRNPTNNSTVLYVFGPDNSEPIETIVFSDVGFIRSIRLSDNGNLIGFHTSGPPAAHVYNREAEEMKGSVTIAANNTNFGMCGNGHYLLTGWQEAVIHHWNGVFYEEIFRYSDTDGTWYHNQGLISADGSTAVVYANKSDYTVNRIYLVNLLSAEIVWTYEFSRAPGSTLQMNPSQSSISRDGSYFVMANWGDDSPNNPAFQVFQRSENEPIFTISPSPEGSIQVTAISQYAPFYVTGAGKTSHMNTWGAGTNLYSVDLETDIDYSMISGIISNQITGNPVENAKITIGEWDFTYSNSTGFYNFNNFTPGSYDITVSRVGYTDNVIENFLIAPNENISLNIDLEPIPTVEITGTVIGNDNPDTGLEDAIVTLSGYMVYEVYTDENGNFTIPGVYIDNDYLISINHSYYNEHHEVVNVGTTDLHLGDFILSETPFPVSQVTAELNNIETEVNLTWTEPVLAVLREFKYDNGIRANAVGFTTGTANSILGAVHRHDSVLLEISWHLSGTTQHEQVNLFVFDLDANGAPISTGMLYSESNVDNIHDEWNTFELNEPLYAENGFFIGISATTGGHLGISIDDGSDLHQNTQYYIFDYTTGSSFTAYSTGNFFVRAWGYDYGRIDYPMYEIHESEIELLVNPEDKTASLLINNSLLDPLVSKKSTSSTSRYFENYSVFRFNVENQHNSDLWEHITDTSETSMVDSDWSELESGHYRYAVKALYSTGIESPPALSNILQKGGAQISIEPESFDISLESGSSTTLPMTITNPGDYPLSYSISINYLNPERSSQKMRNPDLSSDYSKLYPNNVVIPFLDQRNIVLSANKNDTSASHRKSYNHSNLRNPVEIHYDTGYTGNGIGTGQAASWISAVRFTTEELAEFYGDYSLSGVKFHIRDPQFTNLTVKVWQGGSYGNPGTEIYSQDITSSVLIDDWTYYSLSSPIGLIENLEYWIGYSIDATGDHPSSCDAGPMVEDKGAWMYFNNSWSQLTELNSDLNFNWCIRGLIQEGSFTEWLLTSPASGTVLEGENIEITLTFDASELIPGFYNAELEIFSNTPNSPFIVPIVLNVTGDQPILEPPINLYVDELVGLFEWDPPQIGRLELIGYNVYLDDDFLAETDNTHFQFENLIPEQSYTAGVQSIFNAGVSEIATLNFTFKGTGTDITPELVTRLKGNYPNPFNPETKISFSLSEEKIVKIELFNLKGEKIKVLLNQAMPAGDHSINWTGVNHKGISLSSGVYFYRMTAGEYIKTNKMLMLK